ncbi:hypothetical protein BDZ91DRAFT_474628 [Kalaharituber pfeilii]|nr:hypothetical protein BDZ91DRAFT_474628 [Kalaharituber pfeilii]
MMRGIGIRCTFLFIFIYLFFPSCLVLWFCFLSVNLGPFLSFLWPTFLEYYSYVTYFIIFLLLKLQIITHHDGF